MSQRILVKRSSVPSKVPLTTDLLLGELSINTNDGKLFLKKNNGSDAIVEVGAVSSSTVTTALGYTPANKAGDTFTGTVTIPTLSVTGNALINNQIVINVNAGRLVNAFGSDSITWSAAGSPGSITIATNSTSGIIVNGSGNVSLPNTVSHGGQNTFTAVSGVVPTVITPVGAVALSINGSGVAGAGAQILLTGDGGTSPAKTIRARGGLFEILNDAGSAVAAVSDAGGLTLNAGLITNNITTVNGALSTIQSLTSGFNTLSVTNAAATGYAQLQLSVNNTSVNSTATFGYVPGGQASIAVSNTDPLFIMINGTTRARVDATGIIITGNATATTFNGALNGNATTVTSVTSGQVTTALGYTPANKAGESFTGVVNVTTSGTTGSIVVTDTGSSGSNIRLVGNGGSTPSKTIRVQSGTLQVTNDGYSTSILTLTDAGNLTVTGSATATSFIGNATSATTVASITSSQVTTALGYTPANKAGDSFTGVVNVTTSGASTTLGLTDTGVNGANLHLTGNGATTPSKSIRVQGGFLQVMNDAYTTAILALTDAGNLTVTGDVTAFSDARVKTDVKTIDNPLGLINKMRGVTFIRTDMAGDYSRRTGVIAQEMQAILPEVVYQGDNGTLSVAYGNIVGVLIEAIKELKQEIELLKAK